MKKMSFTLQNEPKVKVDSRYSYSDAEIEEYISKISEKILKDVRLNEIREAQSVEEASKFVTTPL